MSENMASPIMTAETSAINAKASSNSSAAVTMFNPRRTTWPEPKARTIQAEPERAFAFSADWPGAGSGDRATGGVEWVLKVFECSSGPGSTLSS